MRFRDIQDLQQQHYFDEYNPKQINVNLLFSTYPNKAEKYYTSQQTGNAYVPKPNHFNRHFPANTQFPGRPSWQATWCQEAPPGQPPGARRRLLAGNTCREAPPGSQEAASRQPGGMTGSLPAARRQPPGSQEAASWHRKPASRTLLAARVPGPLPSTICKQQKGSDSYTLTNQNCNTET